MPPSRRQRVVVASPPTPGPSAAPSAWLRTLRARLDLPATATPQAVVAAAVAALDAPPAPVAPAPAPPPAPVAPRPVVAAGPTAEELGEDARWEEVDAALFGLPLGPASAALAQRGLPMPAQARSAAYAAAQQASAEEFARNADADHRAQVAADDAVRATRVAAAAADRQAREAVADRLLFPELDR